MCLFVPCVSDVYVLESNVSATGVGAVLSVKKEEGLLQPVAFFSRQLNGAQCRYSADELEGLAMYEATWHFSFYLYRKKFTVITDNQALVTLMTVKQDNRRLENWSMKLSEYLFEVVHRKGLYNMVAHCLRRCPWKRRPHKINILVSIPL